MKTYIQGLLPGFYCATAILLMGAGYDKLEVGRYEYYISSDDITKKHYSRILILQRELFTINNLLGWRAD